MTAPVILSVDDSSVLRRALVQLFAPYDCVVQQAADGEAGLVAVREHRPALILLDYNMPVLDGVGMLQRLRLEPDVARTPVIMLTANAAPEMLARVARLGVRDYVVKPFDGPSLLAKVSRLVPLRQLPAA
ncbi:MAG: response regulator [Pseudomonadota bacterium]|nr:response regulator [Pseudomonadota bacterium]